MSAKPLSISKMNSKELGDYIAQVSAYTQGDELAKIRICECCIKVEAD